MATRRVRLRMSGRVQGVWYRASLREEALRLRLRGWVRNDPDGAVSACVEGDAERVDALLSWCGRGPPGARVDRVEVADEPAEGPAAEALRDFEIRR